jgi:hypothetical protein
VIDAAKFEEAPLDDDPRQLPWGIYVADDLPAPYSTGSAVFRWFATPEAVADEYITGDSAEYLQNHVDAVTIAELAGAVRLLAGCTVPGDIRMRRLEAVNSHLSGYEHIRWFGTFEELCTCPGGSPETVRAEFRHLTSDEEEPGPVDGHPIDESEIEHFVQELSWWL